MREAFDDGGDDIASTVGTECQGGGLDKEREASTLVHPLPVLCHRD